MTKFLDKSFSSRAPNDNYRSGWDAIDWRKKSSAETLSAPPEQPKTPFGPESDTVRHHKPPCAICRLALDLCVCAVPDSQETEPELPESD